ncbi:MULTISPECIES: hypothetical protein [Sphingobacterium]|uniref:hypothetical protein n=1 Tax=Sphingobacterium TaxID=28453 RepID=UPI0025810C0E|nr:MULTISPECIES: hypothetical protein [Sphingobacterium]
MEKVNIPLLPIEIAFYELNDKGYDPLDVINEFWASYHINMCHDNIEDVMQGFLQNTEVFNVFEKSKKYAFFLDILRLLIAYFQVHYHKIKIDDHKFSLFKIPEEQEKEMGIRNIIYDFFDRISQQP